MTWAVCWTASDGRSGARSASQQIVALSWARQLVKRNRSELSRVVLVGPDEQEILVWPVVEG